MVIIIDQTEVYRPPVVTDIFLKLNICQMSILLTECNSFIRKRTLNRPTQMLRQFWPTLPQNNETNNLVMLEKTELSKNKKKQASVSR